jgi:glycosyltransferase involved in cell wall biosynthesis
LEELFATLIRQTCSDFEVVVVEDGSKILSDVVVERYKNRLNINYVTQPNGGPASARNHGAMVATGDFLVIVDSDCLLSEDYVEKIYRHILEGARFFGTADAADKNFSTLQKAINYSMTSLFTTGGVRGNRRSVEKFVPRSFSLGIEKGIFEAVGGFNSTMTKAAGEDIDFSIRVTNMGVEAIFLPDIVVYHKRRTSLKKFYRQVYGFGCARVNLIRRHQERRKLVYALPAIFTVGCIALIITAIFWLWAILPVSLIVLIWFVEATIKNCSLIVGTVAILTSFIQLIGYGVGFLQALIIRSK